MLFGRFFIIILGISDGRSLVGAKGVFFGFTNSRLGIRVILKVQFQTKCIITLLSSSSPLPRRDQAQRIRVVFQGSFSRQDKSSTSTCHIPPLVHRHQDSLSCLDRIFPIASMPD